MSSVLTLYVPGRPAPQGSKRAVARRGGGPPIMVESSKRLPDWRGDVRRATVDAWGDRPPLEGPVGLSVGFGYARPLSHHVGGRRDRPLRPTASLWKASTPDIDKLARAILDALTGIVYLDDAQVVSLETTKGYGDRPGARIVVRELTGT